MSQNVQALKIIAYIDICLYYTAVYKRSCQMPNCSGEIYFDGQTRCLLDMKSILNHACSRSCCGFYWDGEIHPALDKMNSLHYTYVAVYIDVYILESLCQNHYLYTEYS